MSFIIDKIPSYQRNPSGVAPHEGSYILNKITKPLRGVVLGVHSVGLSQYPRPVERDIVSENV